ncbi:MAG: inositol monophosphatase family protein [Hyphomicrobiaceae bacterium]
MPASALMNVMTRAARKAGRGLVRDFGEVEQLQVSVKGPSNFVTSADLKAEQVIFEELSQARPGYGFLMEERGAVEGADKTHRWIVDPLDGTTNFMHGVPLFSISIALEREGEIVAGLVYNPVLNELFAAEKGKGAFVNDHRLRVAARRKLADALVVTGIPHRGRGNHQVFLTECATLMEQVSGIRRLGSAALDLAWVAAGRFDIFWERGLAPWDMAAGILLVQEAGGTVTDMQGRNGKMFETGNILAGNETLHHAMVKVLGGPAAG